MCYYIITQDRVTNITLNSFRSIQSKKKSILPSFIPSTLLFLSLCASKFLTYILLLLKQLLLKSLAKQIGWQLIPSVLVHLRVFIFHLLLKDHFAGQNSRFTGFFFFFKTLNYLLHSLLACMVSDEKSGIIIIFVHLQIFFLSH